MVTDRVFVDRDAPKALIQGVEDYTITSKPVQVSYLAEERECNSDGAGKYFKRRYRWEKGRNRNHRMENKKQE